MNLALATSNVDLALYENNLGCLEKYNPSLAKRVRTAPLSENYEVQRTTKGLPVVFEKGVPLHSMEDPLQEAFNNFEREKTDTTQRYLVFGLGVGYQIVPIVAAGYSAVVYDPDISSLKLAFSLMDFTSFIPFINFHFGSDMPDLPRNMKVLTTGGIPSLHEDLLKEVLTEAIDHLPPQVDFETGVYYGTYRNVTCLKNPIDMSIYQMMIYEIRPTLIIEIGVLRGGSTLFFADIFDILGGDRMVYAYDIVRPHTPELHSHPRIKFFDGGHDDFDPSIIRPHDRVLVIEDSSHEYKNTLNVLNKFAPHVSPNSYLIVEDTMCGQTRPHQNGGPIRAIEEFLPTQLGKEFKPDLYWENFYGKGITNNVKGFLKKVV